MFMQSVWCIIDHMGNMRWLKMRLSVCLPVYTLQSELCACSAAGLDEADTDAVDALMGMTGLLYAH